MGVAIHRFLGRFGVVVALSLAILATAACGGSSDSAGETTRATAEPAGTEANESTSATAATEPQGEIAPKFELPSGTGEAISLASFAGDKNVVLVFYRGFW
jgi:cytochrome oxidase Cu insertion factor (SCO1/SenC/PrrC family)